MKKAHDLLVGPPPYIFNRQSTPSIIWGTVAALSPALAWGLYSFGISAAAPVLASLLAAAAAEASSPSASRFGTALPS
jgi:Na+-translocating ferredoxin:NAD+ oxidoreductase RnfD subunit